MQQWKAVSNASQIPSDAVPLGIDCDGQPLYAARASQPGKWKGIQVGKAKRGMGASISYGGSEAIVADNFEVLCGDLDGLQFGQVEDRVPYALHDATPIEGGREDDGSVLYVGIGEHLGSTQIGKCGHHLEALHIGFGGREVLLRKYRIMLLRPASDSRILVNITHPTPYKHSFPDAEDNTWPVPPINFQSANPSSALFSIWGPDPRPFVAQTCLTVLKTLYSHPRECPSIPCLSIIVRPYDGCAYASNCEVHISEKYVMDSSRSRRFAHELAGCFMHEVVHIFQYNGVGTANGGFVEGVADYVRILNGLAPPQWRRPTDPPASGDKWDRGYEHTAYFLLFVESRMPHASKLTVSMNLMLRDSRWDEALFQTLTGQSLNSLWTTYLQSFSGQ